MGPPGPSGGLASPGVISVSSERFEQMVADALDSLPPDLGRAMDNVAVLVGDKAEGRALFGLYEGVPLTRRGTYGGATPDRITIYQDTICERCTTEAEVVAQVRKTVIHEIGHHFGISDARLKELGWA